MTEAETGVGDRLAGLPGGDEAAGRHQGRPANVTLSFLPDGESEAGQKWPVNITGSTGLPGAQPWRGPHGTSGPRLDSEGGTA